MPITFNDYKQAKEYSEKLKSAGISSKIKQQGIKYAVIISADIDCPFCEETGFDKAGLKSHLEHGDCEKYNGTENINRI